MASRPAAVWPSRADVAARSVLATFGQRVWGIPLTHLGAVARPGNRHREWHYWWQAHFVDCLVDAARRGSTAIPRGIVARHLVSIWLRNGLRFRNDYYDDMAWLTLAAQRAGRLPRRLVPVLESAITDLWGGGAFWHVVRDFKNTAATAPISLVLARMGRNEQAVSLVDWLTANLADPDTGLYRDGVKLDGDTLAVVSHVFTYNQGPVLGTMLELVLIDEAERLIHAVAAGLTHPDSLVLRTHGPGDGGLFTGILVRYLALAARDPRLPTETRQLAADLVTATAENLWDARVTRGWRGRPVVLFPQDTHPGGGTVAEVVELSTQLSAWMTLEAAACVSAGTA